MPRQINLAELRASVEAESVEAMFFVDQGRSRRDVWLTPNPVPAKLLAEIALESVEALKLAAARNIGI